MHRTIIKKGFALLAEHKHYTQTTVVKKMRRLGKEISEPTFSKILNDKKVKPKTLAITSEGIRELAGLELGIDWEDGAFIKKIKASWEPTIVEAPPADDPSFAIRPGFAFHGGGRLAIGEKVKFFSTAQKEVIEFGVTLNTFASYFINRAEWEYKNHVADLLKKGVNFKCYLLDPECNEARLYFDDRRRGREEEPDGIETIKKSIRKLWKIKEELSALNCPGQFGLYTYKHIPNNYFISVDGASINAKMMVSHYIYGISRANCPTIEFTKHNNRTLYRKYWSSLQLLVKGAKEIGQPNSAHP